jgi:predicted signal transduction protein with EAL and GGDEF domain
MGHEYGDEVLRVITSRWQGMRRKTDFVSRMGGDEFALIIAGSPNENNNAEIADKYMSMLDDKIEVMNHSFYVTASMGVAFYPVDCQNAAELLRFADTAMYNAKHNGKSRICIFNKEQMLEMEESVKLENLLRKAIDNDLFYLKFQPQFSTKDKILRGFETVIRLNDESGNAVSPQVFIPAAENLNLIVDIDRWVLANAMKTGKTLISNNPDIKISINISVKHIFDDSF